MTRADNGPARFAGNRRGLQRRRGVMDRRKTTFLDIDPAITLHAVCLLLVFVVISGCRSGVYDAGKLPPELSVPPVDSTRKVDLTRLAQSAVQSDLIYPGDVIEVTVATGLEEKSPISWPLRVSEQGDVDIPLIGVVRVAGLLLPDAEQAIRTESIARRVYRDPHVSVLLTSRKTIRVTVVGAVNNPGVKELPAANADLLSALLAAGNLTEKASTIVEIRKVPDFSTQLAGYGGRRTTLAQDSNVRVDLIAASQGAAPDYRIEDGSVIMVREREPKTIQVIGLVNKPDQFEIEPDQEVRLLDAIALANGRTLQIADKVNVIRQLDTMKEPVVIQASVREAKRGSSANIRLAPGDIVSVEETPLTFTVGTIQSFVRFGFSSAVPGL